MYSRGFQWKERKRSACGCAITEFGPCGREQWGACGWALLLRCVWFVWSGAPPSPAGPAGWCRPPGDGQTLCLQQQEYCCSLKKGGKKKKKQQQPQENRSDPYHWAQKHFYGLHNLLVWLLSCPPGATSPAEWNNHSNHITYKRKIFHIFRLEGGKKGGTLSETTDLEYEAAHPGAGRQHEEDVREEHEVTLTLLLKE